MFGMQALDIALGLIFVYLLLGLICTAANELIAGLFKLRARNLVQGVKNLLGDAKGPDLGDKFFQHPLIKSLYKGRSRPSYIEPSTFALALLDLVAPGSVGSANPVAKVKKQLKKLPVNSDVRKTLELLKDISIIRVIASSGGQAPNISLPRKLTTGWLRQTKTGMLPSQF